MAGLSDLGRERSLAARLLRPLLRWKNLELRSYPSRRHCLESTYQPYHMVQRLLELRSLGFEPRAVVDGGANRALFSSWIRSVFPDAICYLFEPLEELKPELGRWVSENPGCRLFPGVLARNPGEMTMHVDLRADPGCTAQGLSAKETDRTQPRVVPAYQLNELLRSGAIAMPELIKLDVEGYELEVLEGASDAFGQTEVFLLEVSLWKHPAAPEVPDFAEMVAYMAARDYVVYDFAGMLRRDADSAPALVDVVFAHRDAPFRSAPRPAGVCAARSQGTHPGAPEL